MSLYRDYEVHVEQAGYGYVAHKPNYDGEPCLHGWTEAEVRREIDMAVEADDEAALLTPTAQAAIDTLQAQLDREELETGSVNYELSGRIACLKGENYIDAPDERFCGGEPRDDWQAGWIAQNLEAQTEWLARMGRPIPSTEKAA